MARQFFYEGDDALFGLFGDNILVGAAGNDYLQGGFGRNLLIGGADADRLFGLTDQDLLIAQSTVYDDDEQAFRELLNVWADRSSSYAQRIDRLRDMAGSAYLEKDKTVIDDSTIDLLFGGSGRDWYWLDLGEDILIGRRPNEALN